MEDKHLESPWEELKRKLNEELTPDEFKEVLFLLKDKLQSQYSVLWECDDPAELFTFLETNFTEFEALEILKHVFGILGIHLQFSDRSFHHMIEEFEKKTMQFEDTYKIYRDANFIGRQEEMDRVKTSLLSGKKGVWLCGEGGMGKTTLANEICYRLHIFSNVQIVNINLKGTHMASEVARALLMARGEYSTLSDTDSLFSQALTAIRTLNTGMDTATCILLDSMEDALLNDPVGTCKFLEKVSDTLPAQIKLLITSRLELQKFPSLQQGDLDELYLLPFSFEDASRLLLDSCRPKQLSASECLSILNFSGHSPLAIRLISRTIQGYSQQHPDITVAQMLDIASKRRTMAPVLDVIKFSYETLPDQYKQYLLKLSVFENSIFETDEVAFMIQQTTKDAIMCLLLLKFKNLVEIEKENTQKGNIRFLYCLHPLVLTFLNELEKPKEIGNMYTELILKKIAAVENTHNERFSEAFSMFRDRMQTIRQLLISFQDEPRQFSAMRDSYLYKLSVFFGSPSSREELLQTLADKHRTLGLKTSAAYWTLATASSCIDDNRIEKAEEYLKQIEDDIETSPISDHDMDYKYISAEYFLTKGRIYHNKGIYTESQEYLLQANRLFRQSGSIQRRFSEVARTLNALGNVSFKMKNYADSMTYHQDACDLMRQHLEDYSNQEFTVYIFNLGTVKAQQGELLNAIDKQQAKKLFMEALNDFNTSMEIDVKLNCQHIPSYPVKLLMRSALYHRMGSYDEAIADGKLAIKLRKEIFGENHSLVTDAYYNVASLLYKRNLNRQTGTAASRKNCLTEAYANCVEMEKQIRRGSKENQECEDILNLYTDIVAKLKKTDIAKAVKRFCTQVRTGTLFSSDSSEETDSETTASSSAENDNFDIQRRDSGMADSMSASEDPDLSFHGLSFRQESTDSDVFPPVLAQHNVHEQTERSLKRQRSSDSD